MFDSLRSLRPEVAAGILADTALRLDGPYDAGSNQFVEQQDRIESDLLEELRGILHLSHGDFSAEAIAQITDLLDAQANNILASIAPPDEARLSAAGMLAADVYELSFGPNLANDLGWRWPLESALAIETVRSPHRQQVLGSSDSEHFPALTIYGRFFQHRFPARSFWMLVVGERVALQFRISQVWRAYPSQIDLRNCGTLLDVIKLLADTFGHPVALNGKTAKFFWTAPASAAAAISEQIKFDGHHTDVITVSWFRPRTGDGLVAALVIPMNLTKYFKYVDAWRGWDKSLWDDLNILDKPRAA